MLTQVYRTGKPLVLPTFYYEDDIRRGFRKNTLFKLSSGHVVAAFSDTTEEEVLRFFLDSLFNIEKNLVFTTIRGEELDECNPVLLRFLGFDSVAHFKASHRCICEFFVEDGERAYIGREAEGLNWLEHLLLCQENQTVKAQLVSVDGQSHIFSLNARAIPFDDKERFIVMMNDITLLESYNRQLHREVDEKSADLKRALSLLEKSEAISQSGSWRYDYRTGQSTLSASMHRLLGREPSARPLSLEELGAMVSPEERDAFMQQIDSARESGEYRSTRQIHLPDGSHKSLLDFGEIEYASDGEALCLYAISRDITADEKLKALEKDNALLQLQQLKNDSLHAMFNAIAHHWRQPLSVLSLIAYELQEQVKQLPIVPQENEPIRHNIARLSDQIMHLSDTIDTFALFAHTQREKRLFPIREVADKCIALHHARLQEDKIDITVSGSDFFVKGDPHELMRILAGLTENAREAILDKRQTTPSHPGTIEILLGERTIRVKDNGSGVDEAHRTSIFDPYFTTKFMAPGVGLSLYYNTIILKEAFRASLRLEETATEGSVLLITFPPA
jgi:C4-dicarboxylate-specific signal transduction histidine kinase